MGTFDTIVMLGSNLGLLGDAGRLPGQWRIRIRYRDLRTPWFDHLTVSGAELARLLDGTGWWIDRLEQGPAGRYSALLLKEDS